MKKAKKVSLALASFGVGLIGIAGFLQYQSFQMKNDLKYENVSIHDTALQEVKQIKKENIVEEVVDNPLVSEIPTEEIIPEQEIKDLTTYEDVTTTPVEQIVYDGLTLTELIEKLNRSLKSNLTGKGAIIATHALELGVDPYLATAIILLETGCNSGTCSNLVRSCNNVGGQKGGPSCGGGSYKAYNSLDEGIIGYLDNLYNNYVSKGLTTPETIGPKYAASPVWATKVNNYISFVRNK